MAPDLANADPAVIKRCLGDVVALSMLPAVWAGAQPLRIAESLAAALYTMLGAEFILVALNEPGKGPVADIAQIGVHRTDPQLAAELRPMLFEWVRQNDPHQTLLHNDSRHPAALRITCRQVGHDAEFGIIAAGFLTEDAPAPLHHLLLDVSATQATVGLSNSLLVAAEAAVAGENARLLTAVRSANETLEERVLERTSELAKASEALRQSQKMEAVGQLTGGLAHDFNNLLATISGAIKLMAIRVNQERVSDLQKYIDAAQDSVDRGAALTRRLLAFSRQQVLAPKVINVGDLVTEMIDMIRRTAGSKIRVDADLATNIWPVLVDPSELENCLLNLCINARDAMPTGGKIHVKLENASVDADLSNALNVHYVPSGDFVVMSVADTGSGMPQSVIDRAFEPFFTTKPTGQGTGLGLSMVYGFAKQSGGGVRIDSKPGEGTTVRVYLPRQSDADR